MSSRSRPTLSRFFAILLVTLFATAAGARAAGAVLLIVDLRTDYDPGEEFTGVRTRVAPFADPTTDFRIRSVPAFAGIDWVAGARVGEFDDLPAGEYRVSVDLLDAAGAVVARQQLLVDASVSIAATVLVARPNGSVEKSAALLVDADGDGAVSGGDTLRYTVVALGDGGERFVDELAPELALVAGSVTTTHGVVVEGNSPGDTRVEIGAMGTTGAGTATVEFDAVVLPEVENQGEFLVETGSFDPAGFLGIYRSRRLPTDDPATAALGDPTRTPVACDLASCAGDLEECTDDLDTCETERLACEGDLSTCETARAAAEARVLELEELVGTILADPDSDGVPAIADRCADSAPGDAVDDDGCTAAQFCGAIDLSLPQGNNICRHADWRNDEPVGNPNDCRPSGGACVPS